MSFEEFIEIESTLDVGENDLVPVSIQDDEVYTDLLLVGIDMYKIDDFARQ